MVPTDAPLIKSRLLHLGVRGEDEDKAILALGLVSKESMFTIGWLESHNNADDLEVV